MTKNLIANDKMSAGSLVALDWHEILNRLQSFATSAVAKEELARTTALSAPAAQESFSYIEEFRPLVASGVRPHMESLDLFHTWFPRLHKRATLKTLELKDLRLFCLELLALDEALSQLPTPKIAELQKTIMAAAEPLSAIDHLMTPDGEIRTDASEALYNLTREKKQVNLQLQNTLKQLVTAHEMDPVLQEKFVTTRDGRWVVPVKSGMRHDISGIILDASHSKQTVFMEPQDVVPLNNRLRQIEAEIEQEIERLLRELSSYLHTQERGFAQSHKTLLFCDLFLAKAFLSERLSAVTPHFAPGDSASELRLEDLRHPLLVLKQGEVIANSVLLHPQQRILLLSGPNAGGKTVLLKSVGLAAQMARCGLPICAAKGSQLPYFARIHIAIGDEQNVDENLSTFAAHLRALNVASACHGPGHLLLIDEICGSTDPEEGSALARSFLEQYAQQQVFAVVTSHLGPLKTGWNAASGVVNGCLEYDMKTGRPTYQFILGVPGQSQALQTARRVGVEEQIIIRAMTHLSPETRQRNQSLEEIESIKTELLRKKHEFDQEAKQAKKQTEKYNQLIAAYKDERERWLDRAVRKSERKLDDLIAQAKVGEVFTRHSNLQKIKTTLPEIVKADSKNLGAAKNAEDFAKAFPPGSPMYAPSLSQEAIIQSQPNGKGMVTIQAQSMRLQIHWQELSPPQKAKNPTADLLRRRGDVVVALSDDERTIDLRGQKVEDAIAYLELQLDKALQRQEDRVKVVHGHGTEALKRAVRAHLSRSLYVKNWHSGGKDSGGDGVTWIELTDH